MVLPGRRHAAPSRRAGAGAPRRRAPQARPTIAVFNMAAVMRDYGKAKYQVYLLNKKRNELSSELDQAGAPSTSSSRQDIQDAADPQIKERWPSRCSTSPARSRTRTARSTRRSTTTPARSSRDLYDEIKTVVDKTAEMNGYHIVFAYPDAVTPEEMKNPYLKELKLKPPAAQPFYVAQQWT